MIENRFPRLKARIRWCGLWLLGCLITGASWASAATGPKLEVLLPGQTTPGVPLGVVAWGSNDYGETTVPAGLTGVVAVAAGRYHSVALKQDGVVVAWGLNNCNQINVPNGLSGVVAVAAGGYHSVALKQDGRVVAWGWNLDGQTSVPAGLSGVVAIAAGTDHTVALKQDGSVVAWGYKSFGQTNVPPGLSGVVAISAGGYHTVALKQDGSVIAWGDNYSGQSTVPASLSGVVAIAAGGTHTVALKQDGSVVAWGSNDDGETNVPAGLTGVTAIAAGPRHTVALKQDGSIVAWGSNAFGQTRMPEGPTGAMAIAAGGDQTVALAPLLEFGGVNRLEFNERSVSLSSAGSGDLSAISAMIAGTDARAFTIVGRPLPNSLPVGSSAGLRIRFSPQHLGKHVAVLRLTSSDPQTNPYAIVLTGTAWPAAQLEVRDSINKVITTPSLGTKVVAWGYHGSGQISVPAGLSDVTAISAGGSNTVALKQNGSVVAWGANSDGQISVPAGLSGVVAISAGGYHTVALKHDGSVVAWGGRFFYGSTNVPAGLTGVEAISAGRGHTLALKQDGRVVAWGRYTFNPVNVPAGLGGVAAVAAGGDHSVALKHDGTVVAWGGNRYGQITAPAGLNGVVAIAAGGEHTVALKQDGTVVAWGQPYYGQTKVPAGVSGVTAIAAGGAHTVALKQDGSVVSWGDNRFGQTSVPKGLSGVLAVSAGGAHTLALVEAPGDFGDKRLGTERTHRINLANVGSTALTVSAAIEGPDADQFSLLAPLPDYISTYGSSELSYQFKPTRAGTLHAALKISTNDPDNLVYTLDLVGIGAYVSKDATKPGVKGSSLVYSPPVADRATGAVLQKITFANPTGAALNGLRVLISKLAPGVTVQSSSASNKPGVVEVIYSKPIAKDETVSLILTYHDPQRRTNLQPVIHAESLAQPEPREGPVDGVLVPLTSVRDYVNGPVLEWKATVRKTFVVEYSDDAGNTWYSAVHRLVAGSARFVWTDRGQPETWSKPVNKASRMYRVRQL